MAWKKLLSRDARKSLARRYIHGHGVEIGALHNALWTPSDARVTYVDRMTEADLRNHYPELSQLPLVHVDVVDDGEKLTTFANGSLDFIIANHFLEHTQDPIGTILRHLEVLKPGGVLYMALPDKRFTFDKDRPETDFDHVMRDHVEGPQWSLEGHVHEYAALVMGGSPEQIELSKQSLLANNYSIHYHVWSGASLREFLDTFIARVKPPMVVETFVDNTEYWAENICVIRKIAKAA